MLTQSSNPLLSTLYQMQSVVASTHTAILTRCLERICPRHNACREWPRYCRKVCWTKMDQNGPNDHFGQNDLIPNWVLAFARPKRTKMSFWPKRSILVHLGPPTVLWPFLSLDLLLRVSCSSHSIHPLVA